MSLLTILGVTFDAKMTFEKHLRAVSKAAAQRLGIMRKSWQVLHDRSLILRFFGALSYRSWSIAQPCGAQKPIHSLNYWTELLDVLFFSWRCLRVQSYPSTICSSVEHAI